MAPTSSDPRNAELTHALLILYPTHQTWHNLLKKAFGFGLERFSFAHGPLLHLVFQVMFEVERCEHYGIKKILEVCVAEHPGDERLRLASQPWLTEA